MDYSSDRFGTKFVPGQIVAYANHRGSSSADIRVGKILEVVEVQPRWTQDPLIKLVVLSVQEDGWGNDAKLVTKKVTLTAVGRVLAYSPDLLDFVHRKLLGV